jgi:lipid II:glycine glycyltransferase (peptidoglycan interpeptide bridge formation enzyme)
MIRFREATDADFNAWNDFIIRSPYANLRQTKFWGTIKKFTGWMPHYYLVERNNKICAVAMVQERRIPLLSRPLLYCCSGPVVDWQDKESCEALLVGLKQVLKDKRGLLMRMDPEPIPQESVQEQLLLGSGLKRIPDRCTSWNRTLYTVRISLDLDEDGLFMRMRRTHRQNIKKAVKAGVITIHEPEQDDQDQFTTLMQGLELKRNSVLHTADYYKEIYNNLVGNGTGYLLKAKFNGQNISGLILAVLGDKAWAVFIANDYAHRNLMPNKLLLWEAISLSKQLGCRFLDLGASQGSPDFDPINDPLDNLKSAYYPEIVYFNGYYDLPGPFYSLFRMAESKLLPTMLSWYVKIQRILKR